MTAKPQVLLVGESWLSLGIHIKGFNQFPTGFYEEGNRFLFEALEPEFELTHLPSHRANTEFPETADALREYAVILFSDVGSDTLLLHPDTFIHFKLRPNRLHAVKSYVEQGGGFGMIGGYMSFAGFGGQAHYHRTAIEEILPVNISPYDDRVEVPEGMSPSVVDGAHPIIAPISGEWPRLLGYNRLKAKPNGQVLLEYTGDPVLAVTTFGAGRTLAFASDCAPHWGSLEFTQWDHYAPFWRRAVHWLSGAN